MMKLLEAGTSIVVDRYSKYIDAYPLMTKNTDDAYASLVGFFGTEQPKDVYFCPTQPRN